MLKARSLKISDGEKLECSKANMGFGYEKKASFGKVVFWVKESCDILDDYIESAMYEKVKHILEDLSLRYKKEYCIYRNAGYTEGYLRMVFHLVFEFDGIFYMILKRNSMSGSKWKKVKKIGDAYKINPKRLLLLDESISSEYAEVLESFCDYSITNLTDESLKRKITRMVENNLEKGEGNEKL